ncbi:hypothetical protein Phi40:1_gp082 [Cellulophaga phage phi40:1]|uniref:Uncharacterized protein n=1 Tax=Cellulophaga phage phi38:1 TaxID=1327977 RepID=S0A0U8_9CAUD|nr:hypothetical protein Phi38:1_gp082 [Cellulophaga phage phi38:1]AGO47947.1 hypothetical protein Phi40:1_gp082 [Cellulophaga phage phi40:1]AGO48112.1 hypothetical protein Phi38:1_gp082 [Cellulophaga phage phi38:1]
MEFEVIEKIGIGVLGLVSTIIALNKDMIQSSFSRKSNTVSIDVSKEDLESMQLKNVEHEINIYRGLLDDMVTRHKATIIDLQDSFAESLSRLEGKIEELNNLVLEQKGFIEKQSKRLHFYEKKFGKINDHI